MVARKSPGVDPLGHPPFSRVRLEGPKVHHDFHGNDASVPAKGTARAIPGEHWEMQYNPLPEGTDHPSDAFSPKIASKRPCTHNKVNKEDH